MRGAGYGDLPPQYRDPERARIVVIPVPYDRTSTWGKGAERGPAALIEASRHMELYDIETDSEVCRHGILTDAPVDEKRSPEAMVAAVHRRVTRHLEAGRFPVVVGGEHSVSIGSARAFAERFPGLSVLQLDAHSDMREEHEGSPLNHACVMARISEHSPVVQVGIRSMDASEKPRVDGRRVFLAEELAGSPEWVDRVVDLLSERVYVTLDLDVLDPSQMPSTGTPEPGGLSWYEVLRLARAVCRRRQVVGFDVVELCPGAERAPDFLAAKLVYKLLSYRFAGEPLRA